MDANDTEWLDRLTKAVQGAKSSHVRVSRGKLLKVCLIARMSIKMIQVIDAGDMKYARNLLNSIIETLELQFVEAGIRKVDVRED